MTRPENDIALATLLLKVQKLAAGLDIGTPQMGVRGVADQLANIQSAAREAEWRCNDILKG